MRYDIITVDIDKPYRIVKQSFGKIVELAEKLAGVVVAHWECRPSPSGNTHCWVYLFEEVRDCMQRYMLARLLGDDPIRSLLNLARCIDGDPREILFFEKKPYMYRVAWPGEWFWGES